MEGKERERKVRRGDNDEKYSLTSMVKLRKHSYFPAGFSRPLLVSDMLTGTVMVLDLRNTTSKCCSHELLCNPSQCMYQSE